MTSRTITAQSRRVQFTGNGTAGPFAFSFQVNETSELKVFVDATLKTLTTHYTVSLASAGSGTISFTTGNHPTSSETITIVSNVGLGRTSTYSTGGSLTAASLENDFDTNAILDQQVTEKADRALHAPEFDPTSIDMTLPDKTTRAGKSLGFNSSTGNPEAIEQVTGAAVNVSSLSAGSSPTASVSVSSGTATFALGIPTGATGATGATGSAGAAATISVGTVTTGSAGSSVTVTNSGSSSAATFDFSIPAGATGATGAQGPQGPQGVAGTGTGDLLASNNLSDLANAGTARTNLGLGTIATQAANSVNIDGGAIDGVTIGTNSVVTDLRVDNLKLDGNAVTSTDTNGTIDLTANGTGNVVVKGNTNPGTVVFNCESNSHGQTVKAQPHSASVTNTLTLPPGGDGELVSTVATQTLTNKSIAASQLTGAMPALDGSALTGIAAGATGGGSDQVFYENGQTVTTNYTITNGKNAMSAGPITIASGVTVTVGDGETYTVV